MFQFRQKHSMFTSLALVLACSSLASARAFSTTSPSALPFRPALSSSHHHRLPTASSVLSSRSVALSLRGGDEEEMEVVSESVRRHSLSRQSQGDTGYETVPLSMAETETYDTAEIESSEDMVDVESPASSSPCLKSAVVAVPLTIIKAAGALYSNQLILRPKLTKSATAGIIFGLSDFCAQLIERNRNSDDDKAPLVYSRIIMTFLVGFFYFGPAADAWYSVIFRLFPGTSLVSTLQKALLGQLIFGPIFTCVFFGAGLIEARKFTLGTWGAKIREDLVAVWAAGLGFWPLVDFISFKVVPMQWIPLFVNFCSFVWTVYLSLIANKSDAGVAEDA